MRSVEKNASAAVLSASLSLTSTKLMVDSGLSALKARRYLNQWLLWWTKTVGEWQPADILQAFIIACRPHAIIERVTAAAFQHQFTGLHSVTDSLVARMSA